MISQKIWTKNFIVVCLGSFFMFLTFYILATAFPLYVRDSFHGDQQQMGLSITIYVIGGVLLRPFSGQWADRFGKKKMAVIGMVIFLIACISYFGAKGIALFLVIRLIHGMSYAVASTASSTVASALIPDSRQGEGMGYFSMFMSVAMVIGPALGLFLWKDQNVNVLLLAVCAIAALSLLFMIVIKMPRPNQSTFALDPPLELAGNQRRSIRISDFIEPNALPISLVGFIVAFAYSSLSGFMAPFAAEIHQSSITGYFFVAFAVMIVVFRPLIGKVFDKYNEHLLAYPGILLFAIGTLLLSQGHSGTMILIAGVIMGIGYGALIPCFQTLAIKLTSAHRRGAALGTFFLLFDLGYGIGSYFMGLIASLTDYRFMYVFAGFILLLSTAVYYLFHHRPRAKLQPVQGGR